MSRLKERKENFSKKSISVLDHPYLRDVESAVKSTKRLLNAAIYLRKNSYSSFIDF